MSYLVVRNEGRKMCLQLGWLSYWFIIYHRKSDALILFFFAIIRNRIFAGLYTRAEWRNVVTLFVLSNTDWYQHQPVASQNFFRYHCRQHSLHNVKSNSNTKRSTEISIPLKFLSILWLPRSREPLEFVHLSLRFYHREPTLLSIDSLIVHPRSTRPKIAATGELASCSQVNRRAPRQTTILSPL